MITTTIIIAMMPSFALLFITPGSVPYYDGSFFAFRSAMDAWVVCVVLIIMVVVMRTPSGDNEEFLGTIIHINSR